MCDNLWVRGSLLPPYPVLWGCELESGLSVRIGAWRDSGRPQSRFVVVVGGSNLRFSSPRCARPRRSVGRRCRGCRPKMLAAHILHDLLCGGDSTRATAEEADAAPRPQGACSQIFLIFTCVRCLSPPGSGTHHPRFRGSGFRGSPGAVAEVPEVPGSGFRPSRERRGWVVSGQRGC